MEALRCPKTGQRLRMMSSEERAVFQEKLDPALVAKAREWLVSECGTWSYPVLNGIPLLTSEEAVGFVHGAQGLQN